MSPYDGIDAIGVDRWLERDDFVGCRPRAFECLDCAWRGRGAEAFKHHRQQHHRIRMHNGPIQAFSCCQPARVNREAEKEQTQ